MRVNDDMIRIDFKFCHVLIWKTQERMVTVFADGTEVPACPNYDEESHARARALGYRDDIWSMTVDHELGHTILAEMGGLDYSPALWAVAHPKEKRNEELLHQEECRVLEMQRFHRMMITKQEALL